MNDTEPLAARLRPRTLDEVAGQQHIVGPGRLLRRAIEADQLSSVIFYGPPGTGKTTLARVIANRTEARFVAINAVLAGIKDIRKAVEEAREARTGLFSKRTILFVDEVHRFNKAQQDALLPWVEDGTLILVGATTENPYFEVNKALVSRSRLFRLEGLTEADLHQVLDRALTADAGYGNRSVTIRPEAADHLVSVANGDARALLNALELAAETTPEDASGSIVIDLGVAEESIQRRAILYDREGDAHFDTISAFIKSIRGSDPDASLYWLARMLYVGEDPRFILRRLLILASEDVGLATPEALGVVVACAAAFDRVGLPEGRFHLAHATLALAVAPKSNSTMGVFDALGAVEQERSGDVPLALKDPSRDGAHFGHGQSYLYPHAYADHWVAQQYLPDALQGRIFWRPSDQGYEGTVRTTVERRREAQLAAMVEPAVEPLTHSPGDGAADRWLERTVGRRGALLERVRDAVFEVAEVQRHHLVADLSAGTGLLLWEATRLAPEGQVWGRVDDDETARGLVALGQGLPPLRQPRVVVGDLDAWARAARDADITFDRIVVREGRWDADSVVDRLAPGGRFVGIWGQPRRAQRLVDVVSRIGGASPDLLAAWGLAEDALYAETPMDQVDVSPIAAALSDRGLQVEVTDLDLDAALTISSAMVDRWLGRGPDSWLSGLTRTLDADHARQIPVVIRSLIGQSVPWLSAVIRLVARYEQR